MSSSAIEAAVQFGVAIILAAGSYVLTKRLGRDREWAVRVGHVWWVAAAGWLLWLPAWPGWSRVIPTVFLAVTLGSFGACQAEHDAHLCERCFAEVPADMQAQAERRKKWLWLYHNRAKFFLVAIPATLLLDPSGLTASGGQGGLGWGQRLAVALTFLLVVGSDRSRRLHGHYQPFCPYCRRWRRDRDVEVPTPTPDPAASR